MSTDRRSFIKKAAVGVVGVALGSKVNAMSAKSYSNIIGANDRINVAIQGLGRRYGAYKAPIANKDNNIKAEPNEVIIFLIKYINFPPI